MMVLDVSCAVNDDDDRLPLPSSRVHHLVALLDDSDPLVAYAAMRALEQQSLPSLESTQVILR